MTTEKMHNAIVATMRAIATKHPELTAFCDVYADNKHCWSDRADRMMGQDNANRVLTVVMDCKYVYVKCRCCYKPIVDVKLQWMHIDGCDNRFAVVMDCDGDSYMGLYQPNGSKVCHCAGNVDVQAA